MERSFWCERRDLKKVVRSGDHRSAYQRDRARILHSAAFRRLQAKTQVQSVDIDDFFRTRLTHSLEVAQIGSGICAQLSQKFPHLASTCRLDGSLIESLCLAHDIGHPPFGHGGEIALNYMMRNAGGFEGNAQTLRIVSVLEKYSPDHGMDLSRRTLLGLIKYPNTLNTLKNVEIIEQDLADNRELKAGNWHPPKGIYDVDKPILDWILHPLQEVDTKEFVSFTQAIANKHAKTRFKSFDCSIMELADDIAYGIHDMEDAIAAGLIRKEHFEQDINQRIKDGHCDWLKGFMPELVDKLFSTQHYELKDAIGGLVNAFITAIEIKPVNAGFREPVLAYNAKLPNEIAKALDIFKQFVLQNVIKKANIQRLEYRGQQMIMQIFQALASDPERFLPDNTRKRWQCAENEQQAARVICDYVSGMTDKYAAKIHQQLFLN